LKKIKDAQQNTPHKDVKKESRYIEPVKHFRVSLVLRKVMCSKETTPSTNPVFHVVQKHHKQETNSFVKRYSSSIRLHLS